MTLVSPLSGNFLYLVRRFICLSAKNFARHIKQEDFWFLKKTEQEMHFCIQCRECKYTEAKYIDTQVSQERRLAGSSNALSKLFLPFFFPTTYLSSQQLSLEVSLRDAEFLALGINFKRGDSLAGIVFSRVPARSPRFAPLSRLHRFQS